MSARSSTAPRPWKTKAARHSVGFALTVLQRRWLHPRGHSPILRRRREPRKRLREEQLLAEARLEPLAGLPSTRSTTWRNSTTPRRRNRRGRGKGRRPGLRRLLDRRTPGRNRHAQTVGRAGLAGPPLRQRPQVGRTLQAAPEQHRDVRRPRPPPQTRHLHEHRDTSTTSRSGSDRSSGGPRPS